MSVLKTKRISEKAYEELQNLKFERADWTSFRTSRA
jgi:hypothetical protein